MIDGVLTIHGDTKMSQLGISHHAELNILLNGSMLKSVQQVQYFIFYLFFLCVLFATVDCFHQNVSGSMEYTGPVSIDNLESVGHLQLTNWNGVDVKQMVNRVVLRSEERAVKGKKTLTGNLDIEGNLNVQGSN